MTNAFRELSKQKPSFEEKDPKKCAAYDCPCRSSMNFGSGWACSAHAMAPADKWPSITRGLRDNGWLVEFIDDMRLMDSQSQDWRGFALKFWHATDEFCKPAAEEGAVAYQNRMRGELLYRSGSLPKRPQVRIPKPTQGRWYFASLPKEKEAA